MLRAVCALQTEARLELGHAQGGFWEHGNRYHRRIRAESEKHHFAQAGGYAARSRTRLRANRRQHLSGRVVAGTIVLFASCSWMGALSDTNQEPLHVRIGHAPGWWNHGRSGKTFSAGGSEGWRLTRATSSSSAAVTTVWSRHSI